MFIGRGGGGGRGKVKEGEPEFDNILFYTNRRSFGKV